MNADRPRDSMGRFLPAQRAQVPEVVDRAPRQVRDPRAALTQPHWWGKDAPQVAEWDAETALRMGMMANVIAFRCVQIRAEVGSSFPLRVGPAKPARPGEQADYDPNHPLARLLGPPPGGPNPNTSGRGLIRWSLVQRIATGRQCWEIEWPGRAGQGTPAAFWPIPAGQVQPVPASSGNRYFKDFVVYPNVPEKRTLSREQVFYGWTPSGTDWRQPQAALDAARYPLSIAIMGDRYAHAFLKNGAVPAAIVTTETFESDEAKNRFRSQWEGRYGGPDNGGRTFFNEVGEGDGPVGDAIDVKVLGLSQKDARVVEQHREALAEVAIGLGVPWSRLDASGRTFDNASEEDRSFLLQTVLPDLQDLEDELNMQVAPFFGDAVCWFDLSGVEALRPAPRWSAETAVSLVGSRIVTPNEARGELGLPELDGLDDWPEPPMPAAQPAIEATMEDDDGAGDDPGDGRSRRPGGGPGGGRAPAAPATRPDLAGGGDRLAERGGGRGRGHDVPARLSEDRAPDRTEARRLAWQATEATVSAHERTWRRTFAALFRRQADSAISRLTGKARAKRWQALAEARTTDAVVDSRGRPVEFRAGVADVFDPQFWRTETVSISEGLFEGVVASSVGRIAGTLTGISFDLEDPWAQDFIRANSNRLAGEVTDTTFRQITDALAEGVGEGEGIDELADRVRHVFDVASRSRAEVIARTEVHSGVIGSTVAGAETLPNDVVAGYEWAATGDGRTRPSHAAADGQIISRGNRFVVGGVPMAYPGDPAGPADETVQCRCALLVLTPEEMAAAFLPAPSVPLVAARAAVRLVSAESFEEARFRAVLMEAA